MGELAGGEITALLIAWSAGDESAQERLIPVIFDELRRIASAYLKRDRNENLLQTTALVHEAYIRLVDVKAVQWQSRAHFFAIAAKLMRQVLIDQARSRNALKRGSGMRNVPIDDLTIPVEIDIDDIIELDDLMRQLASVDRRQCQIVEMRVFGGMTNEEIAEVLKLSDRTIKREWQAARAWLMSELAHRSLGGEQL